MCYITGDITRSDYELKVDYNRTLNLNDSLLHFNWHLSEKAENMLKSHFITKFEMTLVGYLNGSNNITILRYMNSTNLTWNVTLKSNQWYIIIGRILTEDNDSWGPEPVYRYFNTTGTLLNM